MSAGSAALSLQLPHRRPRLPAWLLLSPLLGWLLLFVVAPTVILLACSFLKSRGYGQVARLFTLENYHRAFQGVYLKLLLRSIAFASITTALCVVLGYPAAYYIGRSPPRQRDRLLLLITIPFLTSFLIRAYAWFIILGEYGLLNAFLESLRIIPKVIPAPIELLYTPTAIIIALVYTYLPFMILPIYASVEKLDNSLLEAASDLGAGPLAAFWRVILPLTWPGLAAGIMLVFVPSIAMFAVTSIMGGGKLQLIGDAIEAQVSGAGGNLPFGSALGILLLGLFFATFLLFPRRE